MQNIEKIAQEIIDEEKEEDEKKKPENFVLQHPVSRG
jgi:hypothetical protein